MLRLKNLANKYQKRTCRPLYANTQATPYAAKLSDSYRSSGVLALPAAAYKLQNGLVPGMVVTRLKGTEQVAVSTSATDATEVPFGLLANFVGGDLDEGFSGDSLQNEVGVWRGPDAVFEILAPAFDDAGTGTSNGQSLTTLLATAGVGTELLLYGGADGRLVSIASGSVGSRVPVARLIERVSASRIVVDLKV
jgi:hypothetical protein